MRNRKLFENIGWIVEIKIKDGKREEFATIVKEIVAETRKEGKTLTYQYFISDDGDVLVYERFIDVESANIHIDNWNGFAERWLEAAPASRMVLGNFPDALCARHAALSPKFIKVFDGFAKQTISSLHSVS